MKTTITRVQNGYILEDAEGAREVFEIQQGWSEEQCREENIKAFKNLLQALIENSDVAYDKWKKHNLSITLKAGHKVDEVDA